MRTLLSTLAATVMLVFSAAQAGSPKPEFFPIPGLEPGALPFSEAVRVGDLLFLSGVIGLTPDSMETGQLAVVPGGIQAETRAIMEAIKATVERRGSSMDRVVKCTVMLDDMDEWAAMNEVYVEFFPNNKPARSALGADGLALGARVEIECIAAVGE